MRFLSLKLLMAVCIFPYVFGILDRLEFHLLSFAGFPGSAAHSNGRVLLNADVTRRFTVYNAPVAKGANKTNVRKERKAEIQSDGLRIWFFFFALCPCYP